nr:hypothetical protein GCM10025730_13590 [Promicromonospora thailandica]
MTSPTPQAPPRRPTAADGFVVVDKPQGWTSHDVVGRMRRLAGTRKVGHAGTLDPMATGVLVLGIGKATRLLTYVVGADKDYDATIRLGVATTTDDAEGTVAAVGDPDAVGRVDRAALDAAVAELTGDILQVPTSVSAIKVDGKRAYARVRAGRTSRSGPGPSPCPGSTCWTCAPGRRPCPTPTRCMSTTKTPTRLPASHPPPRTPAGAPCARCPCSTSTCASRSRPAPTCARSRAISEPPWMPAAT